MSDMISIESPAFTIEAFRAGWSDDETLSKAQLDEMANAQYAWLINETGKQDDLRGWTYTGHGFTGPWRSNGALTAISTLIGESVDYVISVEAEIRAEIAADRLPSV